MSVSADTKRSRGTLAFTGLTPLLDTIFLLLFILLALSKTETDSDTELVHIQLPAVEPSQEAAGGKLKAVRLRIDASSAIFAENGEELTSTEDLDRTLAQAMEGTVPEEVAVQIHADREARHGVAVELLQLLRVRGLVNVQLVAMGDEQGGDLFTGGAR